MTATCTAPEATTAREAIDALIAVRDNLRNLRDQAEPIVTCLDTAEDGSVNIAARARLAQVDGGTAMRYTGRITDKIGTAAGRLRQAQTAMDEAAAIIGQLAAIAEEALTTGRH